MGFRVATRHVFQLTMIMAMPDATMPARANSHQLMAVR